jgi:hypothetical protein
MIAGNVIGEQVEERNRDGDGNEARMQIQNSRFKTQTLDTTLALFEPGAERGPFAFCISALRALRE